MELSAPRTASRLRQVVKELDRIARRIEGGEAEREELDPIVAAVLGAQRAHFGPRPKARRGEGGKRKILDYLKSKAGQQVYARSSPP